MLIEFKVANYRSIRAEQTLSMVASNYSDELPQNLISCDHVPGLKGTKLVKAVALYGANASGKSNIVAALRFFAEFVRDSATKLQPGATTGAQPFKLDPACLTQPSKFEITAVINGIRTLYGIEMTRERVTSEYLVAYPKGRPQVWFERDWDEKKGKYEWSKSTAHFKHDDALHEKTRENAAFLSVAAQFDNPSAVPLWKQLGEGMGVRPAGRRLGWEKAVAFLRDAKIRELFATLLKQADLGIPEATVLERDPKHMIDDIFRTSELIGDSQGRTPMQEAMKHQLDSRSSRPQYSHSGATGRTEVFDYLDEESEGTQRYGELAAELIFNVATGRLLAIDELEPSLHPLLLLSLLRDCLFWQGQIPGAQLIFTTHNPLLLDQTLLRRDQIWFTEKDQEGATRLYPLTDFKPRKDESLVKGYLAGRYGGIPFIPEGLKF